VLWRDGALPVALTVGIVLSLIGWAEATDMLLPPPDQNLGQFRRDEAPVYDEAPGGRACHYLGVNERLVVNAASP
jgi:hypothetical protein